MFSSKSRLYFVQDYSQTLLAESVFIAKNYSWYLAETPK